MRRFSNLKQYGFIIGGLSGLILFYYLWSSIFVSDNREISYNRYNAIERATAFFNSKNQDVRQLKNEYKYFIDESVRWYFIHTLGKVKTAALPLDKITMNDGWYLRFSHDLPRDTPQEIFEAKVSPGGEILSWSYRLPDESPGASLSDSAAIQVALNFIHENNYFNPPRFNRRVTSTPRRSRIDYSMSWTQSDTTLKGEWEYKVSLQGDRINGFSKEFVIPSEKKSDFQTQVNFKDQFNDLVPPIFIFLFLLFIVEFIKLYNAGEVEQKNSYYFLIFVFLVIAGSTFNGLVSQAFGWIINVKTRSQVQFSVFSRAAFVDNIILSLIIFFAYLVGDSCYHARASKDSAWLLSFDAVLKSEWLNRNVARSLNYGFWIGTILLGIMTLVMFVFVNYFNVYIEHYAFVDAIDKFFPWLSPIFKSLINIFTLIIVCLFGLNFMVTKYLKFKYIGFIPFLLIMVISTFLDINFYPHSFSFIFNGLLGLGLIIIFIKFDFLTTIIASFVFSTLMLAQSLLNTNNAFLVVSGFSATIIGFTPLFLAFLGFRTNRFYEIKRNELPAYIKRITERERMARELEIARNIQLKLLPQKAPRFAAFDISGMCLPAQEVGGDYFEFITLNDHQFGIGIADVSGKGVPAAIYMTLTKGIFLSYCEENFSPKVVLNKVNRMLYRIMDRGHFVSMFYGIIDTNEMSLTYARAGHNPGIWYHRNEAHINLLQPPGMALGLERGELFEKTLVEEKIYLFPGDTLAFYTDGFSEMQNENGDEFGEGRLTTLMQQNVAYPAKKIIQNIMAEITVFANKKAQLDDMTMVVIQMKPNDVPI
jgi:hypothetical protein